MRPEDFDQFSNFYVNDRCSGTSRKTRRNDLELNLCENRMARFEMAERTLH